MKTLSVRPAWAWSIIRGPKRIENRTWLTSYRGPLLIHASKSRLDIQQCRDLVRDLPPDDALVFGAAIGIVDLVDIVPLADVRNDPFAEGPRCWILENPRPIEPIPMNGRLMLFETPDHLIRIAAGETPAGLDGIFVREPPDVTVPR